MSVNSPIDITHIKRRTTWVDVSGDCDFTIYNIPFGIYRAFDGLPRCCTAIGRYIVDLSVLSDNSYFNNIAGLTKDVFKKDALNDFISLGKECTGAVRDRVIELLSVDNS